MSSFSTQEPLFIANNLALDFINTEYGVGARHGDCFGDDRSVMQWLTLAGVLSDDLRPKPIPGLLELARALRDCARAALMAAKTHSKADLGVINRILEDGRPRRTLEWDPADRAFKLVAHRQHDHAAQLLEPVAQSLADLLSNENLQHVRECEAHDCTLFFHDVTKSHRRRWCSMAACGNRTKAAAHRARKSAG